MEKKRISDERLAELIRAAALRREVPVYELENTPTESAARLGDSGGSRCGDGGRLRRPGDGNSAQAVTFCD